MPESFAKFRVFRPFSPVQAPIFVIQNSFCRVGCHPGSQLTLYFFSFLGYFSSWFSFFNFRDRDVFGLSQNARILISKPDWGLSLCTCWFHLKLVRTLRYHCKELLMYSWLFQNNFVVRSSHILACFGRVIIFLFAKYWDCLSSHRKTRYTDFGAVFQRIFYIVQKCWQFYFRNVFD